MPQTPNLSTRDLGIQIEGPIQFAPGDTIRGIVDRTSHVVAPRARVAITLHGRAKAKLNPFERNDSTYYRSDFRLFNTRATTRTLFDGPLHIERAGDPAAWPFAIEIPLFVDPAVVRRSEEQEASYEPLGGEGERSLPETFAFEDVGFSSSVEAFVEYYVEATLSIYHEGWARECAATFPVVLRTPHPAPPIADFDVRPQRFLKLDKFLSHRLVPGCEDMRLSSSQKVRRFFHSRKVPALAVEYKIETPAVIQLDNPTPVPFFLRAKPNWALTSDILHDVPQKIQIDSVHAEVISYTEARAMGSLHAHSAEGSSTITLGRYSHAEGHEGAYLPFLPEDPPLDIGALMNLQVGYGGRIGAGRGGRLYADFTAFNIQHRRHQLRWSVRVSVAGEESEITVIKPVRILPASGGSETTEGGEPPPPFVARRTESWAAPPPDAGPPPAYCPNDKARGDVVGEGSAQG